jgi:hypothetical protein
MGRGSALMVLDTDTGETRMIAEYEGEVPDTTFQPLPDNHSMLVVGTEQSSDLWLATFN